MTASETSPADAYPDVNWRRFSRVFLVFAAVISLIVLALVTLHTTSGQALDQLVLETVRIAANRVTPLIDLLKRSVSYLSVAVACAVVMAIAMARKRYALAIRVGVLIIGSNITTQLLKTWILQRPYLGIGPDLANSFPSGHSTVVLSVAFGLTIVASQSVRSVVEVGVAVVSSLALIAILVSGWHRPSDVIGAILICFIWAMTLAPQEEPQRDRDNLNTGLLVGSLIAFVALAGAVFALWTDLSELIMKIATTPAVRDVIAGHFALSIVFSMIAIGMVLAFMVFSLSLVNYLQTGRSRSFG
ncbi:MAG: phosphatase PAP2 family protein [Actinomycetaceae bacterium]|nr:phosphatase PAP2 family protein [Actinomycetaceae bacterium]